jgi:hypothetical protein
MPIRNPKKPVRQQEANSKGKRITNEQIICALKAAARKLGRTPTRGEFSKLSGISFYTVEWRFSSYRAAVRAAGLKPDQMGLRVDTADLLEDWGRVARKVGAVPSRGQYDRAGVYSHPCLEVRFERWSQVPAEFCKSVAAGGLTGDWTDVLEKIRQGPIPTWGWNWKSKRGESEGARLAYEERAREIAKATESLVTREDNTPQCAELAELPQDEINAANAQLLPPPLWGKKCVTATMLAVFIAELAPAGLPLITAACFPRRPLKDRPLLGAPTGLPAFPFEPVNEMGVMVLFSMLAPQLGFVIESVQSSFPDCEAKIEVEPGRRQHFRIEFEYESRNFKLHGHDPSKCDLIVCWRHNWKDCPPNLQVLELSKIVKNLY